MKDECRSEYLTSPRTLIDEGEGGEGPVHVSEYTTKCGADGDETLEDESVVGLLNIVTLMGNDNAWPANNKLKQNEINQEKTMTLGLGEGWMETYFDFSIG